MTFEYEAEYDRDTVYFSYSYPYTYTDLCKFIESITTINNQNHLKRDILQQTDAGNDIEILQISNFMGSKTALSTKKLAILTARAFPGETITSWVI